VFCVGLEKRVLEGVPDATPRRVNPTALLKPALASPVL